MDELDLPTQWSAVLLQMADALRSAEALRDQGYQAWDSSMGLVNGKLEIVDQEQFSQAQDFFAKAQEVDMGNF